MWVGSVTPATYAVIPNTDDLFRGEANIDIDWQLPLSPEAHDMLFARLFHDYDRDTKIVPVDKKAKYRKQG